MLSGGSHMLSGGSHMLSGGSYVLLVLLLLAPAVLAHDIPADVTVQTFIKPEGKTLTLVVRAPLRAMRDINFPLTGPGFLDLSRVDPFLRDAALLWIAGNIEVHEENVRIDPPRLIAARVSLPSDRSFVSYTDAVQHATGPRLAPRTEIAWDQAMLDAVFEYSIDQLAPAQSPDRRRRHRGRDLGRGLHRGRSGCNASHQ
jgi:hypothetical protein